MFNKPALFLNADMMPLFMPFHTVDSKSAFNHVLAGATNELHGCAVFYSYENRVKSVYPLDAIDLGQWPSVIYRKHMIKRHDKVALSKRNLWARDEGKCRYCGERVEYRDAHYDHYHPKSKGGKWTWQNMVTACWACNQAKEDMEPKGRWKLNRPPHQPEYWELVDRKTHLPITVYDKRWLEFLPEWKGKVFVHEGDRV